MSKNTTVRMGKRVSWWSTLCGLSVGVGSALLADVLISRRTADRRVLWAAVGLVVAALVYPPARRRPRPDPSEAWTVLSACVIAAVSVGCPERSARSLLGVGWMGHAVFDLVFGHGSSTSRLPRWYPALCAGFDIAYGARLLRAGGGLSANGPTTRYRRREQSRCRAGREQAQPTIEPAPGVGVPDDPARLDRSYAHKSR
jgi:hypothetical protein